MNLNPMRTFLFFLSVLLLAMNVSLAGNYKVAVFDFDDRLEDEKTTAKYIERQLQKELESLELTHYSGREDISNSIQLLKKLDSEGFDLIITITTDALIIANHVVKNTATLFTNVNNPRYLGFQTLEAPGNNISGVSYYISVEKQLALYKKIMPTLKHLGFIFDSNNKSKKVELPETRQACKKMKFRYKIEVVSSESELAEAASSLIQDGVQAIAIGSSGMLYKNISHFKEVCDKASVPIFSFNKEGTQLGALASLSSDYELMVDKLLIPMVVSVLTEGKKPGGFPIAFLKENRIFINMSQAKALSIQIPEGILEKAVIIR
jgi:putative ABC transport system substrate-binding protein